MNLLQARPSAEQSNRLNKIIIVLTKDIQDRELLSQGASFCRRVIGTVKVVRKKMCVFLTKYCRANSQLKLKSIKLLYLSFL